MAGVAALAQLPDQRPEFVGPLGAAGVPGDLRGLGGALVEVGKIRPRSRIGERVGGGIASRPLPSTDWWTAETDAETPSAWSRSFPHAPGHPTSNSLPSGASMVSISSMFMSIAPITDLAGKDRVLGRRLILRRCGVHQRRRTTAPRTAHGARARAIESKSHRGASIPVRAFPGRGYWRRTLRRSQAP